VNDTLFVHLLDALDLQANNNEHKERSLTI
jgi:hypothetical protein